MKTLIAFLVLSCWIPYAVAQQNSAPPPLTDDEIRLLLRQLNELEACRLLSSGQANRIKEQDQLMEQERANLNRAIELEKQATALAEEKTKIVQERLDLANEKATLYEQLYKTVTKKPGIGCKILKIFTLGLSGCH